MHTSVPWVANNASFLFEDKKFASLFKSITVENKKQNNPAIATVVNLGVCFLHLRLTEKIEKPSADTNPNIRPIKEFFSVLPTAMIIIPTVAISIDNQTFREIFSFKNKKANNAVKKGIAAKHNKVTAAVVLVIDQIKVIIAVPKPTPPIIPDIPILK